MSERLLENSDRATESSEKDALFADIRRECNELANDIAPEVGELQKIISLLKETLQKDKDPREHLTSFKGAAQDLARWTSKNPYLIREKAIVADITAQFELSRDLRQKFSEYCSFQKAQINNQYRYIQKDLLPKATSSEQKTELESLCRVLKSIDQTYDQISALWIDEYQEIRNLIENKKFVILYELKKMDPRGRYDKDEMKAALDRSKNGTPSSIKNAMQYFWGSPIDESDAGKCRLTDATIRNNALIFADLQAKAIERSKSRKTRDVAKREPEIVIDVPDLTDMLYAAAKMIQNVKEDMQKAGISTEILDRKIEDK